jgi:hypothetical protein
MILEEEFPIGSKWRRITKLGDVWTVIAYHDGRVVLAKQWAEPIARMPHVLDGHWARVPSAPITERRTLIVSSNGYIGTKGFATDDPGERGITLWPAGVDLVGTGADSKHFGIYTWSDW